MSFREKIGEKVFGNKVDSITNRILSFLNPGDTIVDLGAGTCLFTKSLRKRGHDVTPVDIENRSYYSNIVSEVYDGEHLSFEDNKFDARILISVLHHAKNPEAVLKEAMRVSRKIVIHEDVVTSLFQRLFTCLIDSVLNKELMSHFSYKTDKQWKITFEKLGLKLVRTAYEKSWMFLFNPIYFLEKR